MQGQLPGAQGPGDPVCCAVCGGRGVCVPQSHLGNGNEPTRSVQGQPPAGMLGLATLSAELGPQQALHIKGGINVETD